MEIKAYGLKNHPDISSFFDDYGVNDSDDLFDAFGNQADEIDGIKLVWFHPEDDPDRVELHIMCDYDDRATIKRAIVSFLNSGLAESKASEEKMSYEALLAEALKRIGDGPFADDNDLEDSIMSTLDAMPYDIPEGTKEALATDLFATLGDKVTGKGDADEAGADEAAKKPLYAYIGLSGGYGFDDEDSDRKVKLQGKTYKDFVLNYFNIEEEDLEDSEKAALAVCKDDAEFGKLFGDICSAQEQFLFALRRGDDCTWSNPKGSAELNDKDWQGPDYDWLTANV